MPKLIDYPRTSYAGAWEVADVVDDTGGKCALETCARKLNRKVSGSFKAIVGSAVKFGLLTSKRELLSTTTLFRRIKHAYDKQEELLFHREAFLTPPLFTQLCRKFRSRELPVQMLDIMLIREFDVEEINAQSVAKAFTDGARMVGLLDERNLIADIDQLAAQQPPRRELASPELSANSFRAELARASTVGSGTAGTAAEPLFNPKANSPEPGDGIPESIVPVTNEKSAAASPAGPSTPLRGADAVSSLFGLTSEPAAPSSQQPQATPRMAVAPHSALPHFATSPNNDESAFTSGNSTSGSKTRAPQPSAATSATGGKPVTDPRGNGNKADAPVNSTPSLALIASSALSSGFRIQLSGPGLNTVLDVQDEDDLALARALLEKIGRQLKRGDG